MIEEISRIIKILGVNCSEIIIDINLDNMEINTIEIREGQIILHSFSGKIDIEILFTDIDVKSQNLIYKTLKELLYN